MIEKKQRLIKNEQIHDGYTNIMRESLAEFPCILRCVATLLKFDPKIMSF